jgi:tetratricopeptide (TPR) repeat protein
MIVVRLVLLVAAALGAALVFVPEVRDVVLGVPLPDTVKALPVLGAALAGDALMGLVSGGGFGLLGVVVLVSWVVGAARGEGGSVKLKPGQKPTPKLAARLMAERRFSEAAEMYRQLGDVVSLARAQAKTGRYAEAANLLVSDGKYQVAAEILEEGGTPATLQRAAEMWLAVQGRPDNVERAKSVAKRAATMLAKTDATAAVELLLKVGEVEAARAHKEAAAEAYAASGRHGRAAEMLERLGEEARAAAAFEYDASSAQNDKDRRGSALKAARIYAKSGDHASAGRALELAGMPDKAVEAYSAGQAWGEAARLLARLGQQDAAFRLLMAHGQGAQVVAQLESQGNTHAAAEAAMASGDPLRAAELFENANDLEGACRAYRAAGSLEHAADLALRVGRNAEAAEILEQAGSLKKAAEIYEGMGNRQKAAELYTKAGDAGGAARGLVQDGRLQEAARLLAGKPDPDLMDMQLELGRMLMQQGDGATGLMLLRSAVDCRTPDKTVSASVELSGLMEQGGDLGGALAYAQRALAGNQESVEAVMRVQHLAVRVNAEQIRAAYEAAVARAQAMGDNKPARYITEAEIGRGAMGLVFRARDTTLNRMVALKRLPEQVAQNPVVRGQFLEEARSAAGLNHPNIVTVYDAGVELGLPYLAMELVEGGTLSGLLQQQGQLPAQRALEVCAAVGHALEHAHKAGLVHRDVKPGNVLIARDGRAKLTDFGIAAVISKGNNTGVAGTPYYMSPEQVRGEAVDHRADIYSLGCVLYALLTGKPPFHSCDVFKAHLETPPPPLAPLRPDMPPEVDQLLGRCLAKDPAQRYQSAEETARSFTQFAAWMRRRAAPGPA